MKPENMDKVVPAACVLHNFLRNDTIPSFDDEDNTNEARSLTNFRMYGVNVSVEAIEVRDKYFSSNTRSVPWQLNAVSRGREN